MSLFTVVSLASLGVGVQVQSDREVMSLERVLQYILNIKTLASCWK